MSPKKKTTENAKLQVKLVKSVNGRHDDHIATANSLGLRKIGDTSIQPANAATEGKLKKIGYLLEVTEVK